jgi:hypothetical protein
MTQTNSMRGLALVAASVALFGVPHLAHAQVQVSGEGRVGVTFPTGDLSSEGAEAGLGLGAEMLFSFQRNLSAYVGIHRHGFSCDSDCDVGRNPRSTGVGAGLKFVLPSPRDALVWARGGIVANRLSTNDDAGPRNVGFELGTGVDMPIAPRLYLVPNLGFISHDAGGGATASFLTFGVGIHYHFN